jgi:Flp pilus assembly secretin CpaC
MKQLAHRRDWTLGLLIAVVISALPLLGADEYTLEVDKAVVLSPGFDIKDVTVVNTEIVSAKRTSKSELLVQGRKAGTTALDVRSDTGLRRQYTFTIVEQTATLRAALEKDLDTVPEIEIYENNGVVVLRGELSTPSKRELLTRVLDQYKQQDRIRDLTTFRPSPHRVMALRKALTEAGFVLDETKGTAAPTVGTLQFNVIKENVVISGQVHSDHEVTLLRNVLHAAGWQIIGGDDKGDGPATGAVVDVAVAPVLLELDVVFIYLTDEEHRTIGINLVKNGLVAVTNTAAAFTGTLGSTRHEGFSGSYLINGTLDQAKFNFTSTDGPTRQYYTGHLTFKNGAEGWQQLHSGGTLKVKVDGGVGGSGGVEDIDYGFRMRVRGGLARQKVAELQLELELSSFEQLGGDYNIIKNDVQTTVACPLNQTLVTGGVDGLVESMSESGVPVLKKVPMLKRLFSEEKTDFRREQLLILMSPRLAPSMAETAASSRGSNQILERGQQSIRDK